MGNKPGRKGNTTQHETKSQNSPRRFFVHPSCGDLNGAIGAIQVSGLCVCVCMCLYVLTVCHSLSLSLRAIIVIMSELPCRWMRISPSVCGVLYRCVCVFVIIDLIDLM